LVLSSSSSVAASSSAEELLDIIVGAGTLSNSLSSVSFTLSAHPQISITQRILVIVFIIAILNCI
jgi:hypothetical protein